MLSESPDTPSHAGQPVSGNLPFAYPLEQRARLHLQVLGSLICGKPIGFHVNLFPGASRTLNCPLPTEFTKTDHILFVHIVDCGASSAHGDRVYPCMLRFSRSGNAGSRRLRGRLCRVLKGKRTRFLHMVAAITFTDLVEDVSRTFREPPFDSRRVPRCCRVSTSTPPALPVTKSIRVIHRTLPTAVCPASLQTVHVSARRLLMFVASLSVPLPEPPQSAHSISPCTPKEPLD